MTTRSSVYLPALAAGLLCVAAGAQEQNWRTQAGASGCMLVTPVQVMDDGQGDTQIHLELDRRQLRAVTRSSLDGEFGDLGLEVDDRGFIPADRIERGNDAVFEQRITEITEQFIAGHAARVQLRFWPTWPTTGPKTAQFSLVGFTRAYRALDSCQ